MNKVLDFIEKNKYGIIVALAVHVGLFIYFQVTTYKELVIYEPWSFQGRLIEAPDDIELSPEDIITEGWDEALLENEEITSFVQSATDQREKEFKEGERYTSYEGDVYQNVRDFESKVIQQLESARGGESSKSSLDKTDVEASNKEDNKEKESPSTQAGASEKAVAGKTMVKYELENRKPFNNNDWHIRNPGYTCGEVNGIVVVEIRVNENGDVTHAKHLPNESQNTNYCMIRQAEKYALLSRFNYDPNAPKNQTGKIRYQFVFRR